MARVSLSLVFVLPLFACASAADGPPSTLASELQPEADASEPEPEPGEAAAALAMLERRLQDATRVQISFEIESEGAVESKLSGTLHWLRGAEIELRATGSFAGHDHELVLRGDADHLTIFGGGEQRSTGPRPPALIEAVVLGLTRQGLLHNLAMLTAGQPPDHGEGGADEWLTSVSPVLVGAGDGPGVSFGVQVDGQDVGEATLAFDLEGLPSERRQIVDFPDGQMHVVERYTNFVVTE